MWYVSSMMTRVTMRPPFPIYAHPKMFVHVVHLKYRVIQKDGLNFVCLYFVDCTWYVNDLHNI